MRKSFIYRPSPSKEKGDRDHDSGFRVQGSALPTDSSFILHPSSLCPHPSGYTLVEILVATALTLLLMGAVVQMFGSLGQSITDSRSILEASERLNSAAARLQMDLKGVTVKMLPPRNPDDGEGYFEYIEGPAAPQQYVQQGTVSNPPYNWDSNLFVQCGIGPKPANSELAPLPSGLYPADSTVGDFDDILMFTTRSTGKPFVGNKAVYVFNPVASKYEIQQITANQSDIAEVAWFIRGRTLYRRQLLVSPALSFPNAPEVAVGFYANNDISVRIQNGQIVPNTLSDLTRRECRYAHPTDFFPFDVRRWGLLGLPTLRESATWNLLNPPKPLDYLSPPSDLNQKYPNQYCEPLTFNLTATHPLDFWTNDATHRIPDNILIFPPSDPKSTLRMADDVILTNVIGFDVKAWEPALGQYVDLGYEMRPVDPVNPNKIQDLKHYPAEIPADAPIVPGEMFYHRGYCPPSTLNPPQNGYYAYLLGCYRFDSDKQVIFTPRVYDTWSTHYENVRLSGLDQTLYPPGRSTNGFDDLVNGATNGIVDDEDEKITSPPYPVPLRGIQVKIRVFEPDSRQPREITIVQDFLTK